jgi:hypothetical protein
MRFPSKLSILLASLCGVYLLYQLASAQVGQGGVSWIPPTPYALRATSASFGGSLLTAGSCLSTTTSVVGATTSMVVDTTPVVYPGDGVIWYSYVSSTGVVTTKTCALLAITPNSSAYNLAVWQ